MYYKSETSPCYKSHLKSADLCSQNCVKRPSEVLIGFRLNHLFKEGREPEINPM